MNMNYYMKTRLITGVGCVKNSGPALKSFGSKCLIITGSSSAKKSGAYEDLIKVLDQEKISYVLYDEICQNPTISSIYHGGSLAIDSKVDFIIGIGGGSPLDASKVIALMANNPNLTEQQLYSLSWETPPIPSIAIGTTAGTGSEVTAVSIITNSKGLKKSLHHDDLYFTLAFGDPSYTMSLSDHFTRSTAVDALAHCIESYLNKTANDISMTFAAQGIRILMKALSTLNKKGAAALTLNERESLYNASIYGGLAINSTGTALPHALGYFLTELHNVPHGAACAMYLPYFIEHTEKANPALLEKLLIEINASKEDLITLIRDTAPVYDIHISLEERALLRPRWSNNKSLNKTFGDVTPELVDNLLIKLFS